MFVAVSLFYQELVARPRCYLLVFKSVYRSLLLRNRKRMLFRSVQHGPAALATTKRMITVYGFPLSQPTRSVLLLLNASKIKYDFNNVDALKGEHRKPQFLKIHPAGLLPAISEPQLGVIGKHVL